MMKLGKSLISCLEKSNFKNMGTTAQVDHGTIYFDTEEQAAKALDILQKWIKNVESGQCHESLKGDYSIYSLEHNGNSLYFRAESGSVRNLEWQMENFRDAAKELEGCAEFVADVVIMDPHDSVWWSKE